MKSFWEGFLLPYQSQEIRPLLIKPLLIGVGFYLCLTCMGFFLVGALFANLAENWGIYDSVGRWAGRGIFAVIWYFASIPIFVMLVTSVAGIYWEQVAQKVEMHLGATNVIIPEPDWGTRLVDIGIRLMVAAFLGFMTLVTGWCLLGIFGILFTGVMCVMEFTAPSYALRQMYAPSQLWKSFGIKGWMILLLLGGLASVIPIVSLIVLPGMICGASKLVAEQIPISEEGKMEQKVLIEESKDSENS